MGSSLLEPSSGYDKSTLTPPTKILSIDHRDRKSVADELGLAADSKEFCKMFQKYEDIFEIHFEEFDKDVRAHFKKATLIRVSSGWINL